LLSVQAADRLTQRRWRASDLPDPGSTFLGCSVGFVAELADRVAEVIHATGL
jgi:hypothetical protein